MTDVTHITTLSTRTVAMRLNHHCMIGNGFYSSRGGRFYRARTKSGVLQLFNGEEWVNALPGETFFDGNSRPILWRKAGS